MSVELDPCQRRAVSADRVAATNVVAGAGTGKTTVLVERFLKVLRDDGVDPERILALTFTLKAASEMRHRIHEAVRESMPHLAERLHGAWIMNFHQFGLRLIRDNAPAFGVDPAVDVVTPAQHRRIENLLKRRFIDGRIDGVPADFGGEIPPPTKMESRFDLFFEVALKCRGEGIDAEALRDRCTADDVPGYVAYIESIVAVARAYGEELNRQRLIDFSDMITIPARGLRELPAVRSRYQQRFDHILVDEFQDTSRAQNDLLDILSGGEFEAVTVVGDRKQSIYRWRDARVENIRDFPGAEAPLTKNYRSTQAILDVAHAFIRTDDEFRSAERESPLESNRGAGTHPVVLFHPEADHASTEEADALAAWVRYLTAGAPFRGLDPLCDGERVGYGDVAVLLRSLKSSGALPDIERSFERHRIPYAVIGGANAAETRALESWHAALSLLRPGDRIRELLTVLEGEPFCVGDAALHELFGDGDRSDRLAEDSISRVGDPRVVESLRDVRSMVGDLARRWRSLDFRRFIWWAVEESPLAVSLFARGATSRAVEDIVSEVFEALDVVSRARSPVGLSSFLDHLRASIDDKKFRDDGDLRLPSNRVRIMTIHQSKGLEFPAVAVAGIKPPSANRDRFFVSRDRGVYFAAKDKAHWKRGFVDTDESEHERAMEEQEARCLLYVAMTRARDFLWVGTPFRDGVRRTRGEKRSLFADVLDCAGDLDSVVVVRHSGGLAPPGGGERAGRGTVDRPRIEADLRAWGETRRAIESSDGAPPPPSSRAIDFATWAELAAYRTCPLQYRYRFQTRFADVLGAELDARAEPRAAVRVEDGVRIPAGISPSDYGVLVHDALRRVYAGDGSLAERSVLGAARAMGVGDGECGVIDGACSLVAGVVASEVGVGGADLRAEEPFSVRLDSLVVHGVFDRIERSSGGWRVIDYKVGRPHPDHEFQVQVYAWALGRIGGGEAVESFLCYAREGGARVVRVGGGETAAAVGDVARAMDRSLVTGEYAARAGAACPACPYGAVCPSAERP